MMIDFFVMDTFARLAGVKALIDHADRSIPEIEWQAQEALKARAESEGWNYQDYDAERQGLEADYREWVTKYTKYSAVILLCSITETRLLACAGRVGKTNQSAFRVGDIKGSPLDATAVYLKGVVGLDITTDAAWQHLLDIQTLRNIIVQRGGGRILEASSANRKYRHEYLRMEKCLTGAEFPYSRAMPYHLASTAG